MFHGFLVVSDYIWVVNFLWYQHQDLIAVCVFDKYLHYEITAQTLDVYSVIRLFILSEIRKICANEQTKRVTTMKSPLSPASASGPLQRTDD